MRKLCGERKILTGGVVRFVLKKGTCPSLSGTRLQNGEEVTVYANVVLAFTVLTPTTLVRLTDGFYGSEEATRRLLPLLRPVGE
jgi:hypothetical protein